ncbi:Endonuclease/exonuclease/phosphatase family domain-containing protein 1 [Nibea albiflora]|uniref:Endonuclease/exonuclease/phosphatase family domain-containing protein 1 n=1 Tax=Nibea albiflora TaxID=240163 RepID=A0ACB7ESI4_NIBAL|nr:Endonuclease/exonuclease/phosphatase family domain-containing protein 1 [Nibea albiflora]
MDQVSQQDFPALPGDSSRPGLFARGPDCMLRLHFGPHKLNYEGVLCFGKVLLFCAELNQGTLASVRKWKWPRGLWKSIVSEKPTGQSSKGLSYSGFLWDTSSGVELRDASVLDSPVVNGNGNHTCPRLYLAHFSVGSYELTVVNVHLQATAVSGESNGKNHNTDEAKCHRLSPKIQETLKGEKELVVLGDFGSPPQSSELEILRKEKLCPLVPSTQFTNISTRTPQGTRCLDNIWMSRSLKKIYSGHCMVVREGLTNPLDPRQLVVGRRGVGSLPRGG